MTLPDLESAFDRHRADRGRWDRVTSRRSPRPDLHALLLLDELVPGTDKIIADADRNVVYLGIDLDALAAVATDEIVLELVRCGVRRDVGYALALVTG